MQHWISISCLRAKGVIYQTSSVKCCTFYFKLFTNIWAWELVPKGLVELSKSVARKGGIHGNPASGYHCHTESLSGILTTNTYLGRKNHREGEAGRKICKAMAGKLNMTLQITASPCWISGATPSLATEKPLTRIERKNDRTDELNYLTGCRNALFFTCG